MRKSQKRNCERCKSLQHDGLCELKFKNRPTREVMGIQLGFVPIEPCYKPLTTSELMLALEF